MISDEEHLAALKTLYLYITKVACFNQAMMAVLINRQLMSTEEFAESYALAWASQAEARERIQNMTLRNVPDILKDFEGPLQ